MSKTSNFSILIVSLFYQGFSNTKNTLKNWREKAREFLLPYIFSPEHTHTFSLNRNFHPLIHIHFYPLIHILTFSPSHTFLPTFNFYMHTILPLKYSFNLLVSFDPFLGRHQPWNMDHLCKQNDPYKGQGGSHPVEVSEGVVEVKYGQDQTDKFPQRHD